MSWIGRTVRLAAAASLVVSTFALAAGAPAGLAQGETMFRVEPLEIKVGLGQIETVKIVIENVKELYGGEVHLKFDPSVVEVVDADPSKDGIQITPGDFLKPDFVAVNKADNISGTIDYALTQLNPTPAANGSGVFMTVQFRGKALGKTTKITAKGNILAVIAGPQKVVAGAFTWVDGSVTVVEAKPPTPTPTAAATLTPTRAPTAPPTATVAPTATPFPAQPAAIATPAAAVAPGAASSDDMLMIVAIGAFLGAAILLLLAAVLLLRKPPARRG
jgi:hypothetical protein